MCSLHLHFEHTSVCHCCCWHSLTCYGFVTQTQNNHESEKRKLCLWLHLLISYNTEPACLTLSSIFNDLRLPVLLTCSKWDKPWRVRIGGDAGILDFFGAVKRKGFPGVFSVLIHFAQWYSSLKAKHFPGLSLLCQIGAFQGASLCSCQGNKFTENPGPLRTSESITCSAPALPASATNLVQLEHQGTASHLPSNAPQSHQPNLERMSINA